MSAFHRFRNACVPMTAALLLTPYIVALQSSAQPTTGDLLIADFEGADYGGWKLEGEAFGTAPARGTLPSQMEVKGFEGQGLVNTYQGGDKSTGRLTSPPFLIKRKYLNFLIGGGKHPGQTCLDLLVEGKVVKTATGPNDQPGGAETLEPASWDLTPWIGKQAELQIVDEATGGWGHINVDHIVLSDTDRGLQFAERSLPITARFLHLPVDSKAPQRRVKLSIDGRTVHEFDIKLGDASPQFWAFTDLEGQQGQDLTIEARLPGGTAALAAIKLADAVPDASAMYGEPDRPGFHFTARRGWLNDPNGLVYHNGLYHLFFQHNPYGWDWGNMHWGHATSTDLFHWTEHPEALVPRQYGDWCFSGSAVVDTGNTSGFSTDGSDPLVLAYTSTGRGECIAYSNDNGASWTEYEGNPVVKHQGRDPRLLWYAPGRHWVMAVYGETEGRSIDFHTSTDLKNWTFASRIPDFFECPDLFSLPLDGKAETRVWVLYAADGKYLTGSFDGRTFIPLAREKQTLWHGDFYAAQTYSNAPEERTIQVGWGRGITFPDMPFNQQMTVPCELTLVSTPEGPRLHARPVKELANLRRHGWHAEAPTDFEGGLQPLPVELAGSLEVQVAFDPGDTDSVEIAVNGVEVKYLTHTREIVCGKIRAPLPLVQDRVELQILIDRGSVEVFGNQGSQALSAAWRPSTLPTELSLTATGGKARLQSLVVHELESTWPTP